MASLENLPNGYFSSISDFMILQQTRPLGSGSFGIVRKGIHKLTNKMYAIKIVTIENDVTESELLLLSREISIHYKLNHPHIVKLWAVISQGNKIYMILDYAENGNLFSYLNKKGGLTENQSFKIFYQVLQAIDYMHKNDVFHRDLKPENILLDNQMNVKICDFGWVADDIHRKRTTFCGTYEYMAPEMIAQIPYDYKIDIWALGILLYELNHGKAPFPAQTIEKIKYRFEKGVYQIKPDASQSFKKLIVSLLQFQPSKRLQINEIKKSQWVSNAKNYFHNLASLQLKGATHIPEGIETQVSPKNNENHKNHLFDNYVSNQHQNMQNMVSEDDRKKKLRKKYRTLEEQEVNYITQKSKGHTKQYSNLNMNGNTNQKILQPINQNINYKGYNLGIGANTGVTNNGFGQKSTRKKKIGSARGHMRTQSSQVLMNKFNKIVFNATQQKSRMQEKDDKKKKQLVKRS